MRGVQRHDFAYDLPPNLIAQSPLAERSGSRLLVVQPVVRDCTMRDFPSLLRPGDLLVFNDTKVVAARLVGTKPSGGRVEIFLERVGAHAENDALVQLRASKPIREGLEVTTRGGVVRVLGREDDLWRVGFPGAALEFFEKWGDVPLPPYIHRAPDANDRERYQSIFARERGAVAAPTASLHFDSELIRRIEQMGVKRAFVTLHVGAGTFQPVRIDDLDAHVMHAERVSVSAETCRAIEATRAAGGRVIAIGTTVIRALESAAQESAARDLAAGEPMARTVVAPELAPGEPAVPGAVTTAAALGAVTAAAVPGAVTTGAGKRTCLPLEGWSGETRLFIRPGFNFQVADALLTNFHLPESTLLMLVCAFAGMTRVLAAYEHAVREKYRFFSYGDAMFLTRARG
ncbi:MAG: S-adenosylmethionine:tRNA ribosyltransferase-isomerase [Proteobacteria bacterium]|nr:S-adenosylmethionine:tRNA ribosyltransferase-isomerase [Pseudomonadota bacterium]